MKFDSTPRCGFSPRFLWPAVAAFMLSLSAAAHAEPALAVKPTRVAAPLVAAPAAPKQGEELLVMICRRGVAPTQGMQMQQELPQDLPLVCLTAPADEEALQMGPDRFHELLNKAAESGLMFVLVIRPQ